MRDKLAAYYQQELSLTAYFDRYSKTEDGSNVACINRVMLNGDELADHLWIHRSGRMKDLDLQQGDLIAFDARVTRYTRYGVKPETGRQTDYGLHRIRDVIVLKRATVREE